MQLVSGKILTELEAIRHLASVEAFLLAAGGVGGAEGSIWLGIRGTPEQMAAAEALLERVIREPPFVV